MFVLTENGFEKNILHPNVCLVAHVKFDQTKNYFIDRKIWPLGP